MTNDKFGCSGGNRSDLFTMGPDEAAFDVSQLTKPRSVIPEHFNQVATSGGTVNAGTKLERFIQQLEQSGYGDIQALVGFDVVHDQAELVSVHAAYRHTKDPGELGQHR